MERRKVHHQKKIQDRHWGTSGPSTSKLEKSNKGIEVSNLSLCPSFQHALSASISLILQQQLEEGPVNEAPDDCVSSIPETLDPLLEIHKMPLAAASPGITTAGRPL